MKWSFSAIAFLTGLLPMTLSAETLEQAVPDDIGLQAAVPCRETFAAGCPVGDEIEKTTTVSCDPTIVWGSVPYNEQDPELRRMCTCRYQPPERDPAGIGTFRCEELINRPLVCIVEEGKSSYIQRKLRKEWCSSGIVPPKVCEWRFEIPPSVPFQDLLTGKPMNFTQFINDTGSGATFDSIMESWTAQGKPLGMFEVGCRLLTQMDELQTLPRRTQQCQEAMIKGHPEIAFRIGQCMQRGNLISNVPCCVRKDQKNGGEGELLPTFSED